MISQQPDQRRRHRSREEAAQLAAEYEASNLTQAAFCSVKGISLKSLNRYVTHHRKHHEPGHNKQEKETQRLIPVEVAPRKIVEAGLTLVLRRERRIEVRPGFDVGTLRQLVAMLEQN